MTQEGSLRQARTEMHSPIAAPSPKPRASLLIALLVVPGTRLARIRRFPTSQETESLLLSGRRSRRGLLQGVLGSLLLPPRTKARERDNNHSKEE